MDGKDDWGAHGSTAAGNLVFAAAISNAYLINRKGISTVLAYKILTFLTIIPSARAIANLAGIKCGAQISFGVL